MLKLSFPLLLKQNKTAIKCTTFQFDSGERILLEIAGPQLGDFDRELAGVKFKNGVWILYQKKISTKKLETFNLTNENLRFLQILEYFREFLEKNILDNILKHVLVLPVTWQIVISILKHNFLPGVALYQWAQPHQPPTFSLAPAMEKAYMSPYSRIISEIGRLNK